MSVSGERVAGKVVVITGAGSGIGAAAARVLGGLGARVVLGARRGERAEEVAEGVRGRGGEAVAVAVDVRRREDVREMVRVAVERFGGVDVLVANAGVMPVSAVDELRVDDWEAMVDTNLKGVLHGVAAALPVFRAQGRGHFVHVASTAAHRVVPAQAVYSATKAAVRTFSEGLRQEAGERLRVTVVSPGFTATSFAEHVTSPAAREGLRALGEDVAMPPSAVAEAIAYAIGQPDGVDVGEIVVRPTAQG
ncbi:SDR family oxidoreductase [Actinosynnema pretiosum]|uniref:Short-chain dehydrogenase/reductase SDR n=1 Tax=Actinosynnema pretiosum TaxID=42197 RepID=A0A290Z4E2_9PSEU|nr:SDR family oxidoreductase [Actinosynnema pretiosum]ATE53825.1 short-chain dehydrogenase/reductase SDR [Actinosynnema pretiosum]